MDQILSLEPVSYTHLKINGKTKKKEIVTRVFPEDTLSDVTSLPNDCLCEFEQKEQSSSDSKSESTQSLIRDPMEYVAKTTNTVSINTCQTVDSKVEINSAHERTVPTIATCDDAKEMVSAKKYTESMTQTLEYTVKENTNVLGMTTKIRTEISSVIENTLSTADPGCDISTKSYSNCDGATPISPQKIISSSGVDIIRYTDTNTQEKTITQSTQILLSLIHI